MKSSKSNVARGSKNIVKRLFLLLATSFLLLTVFGCGGSGDLHISANTFALDSAYGADDIPIISEHVSDATEAYVTADTTVTAAPPEATYATDTADTHENDPDGTVYWVSGGEVWHVKRDCPSLSRSENILSGTISEAMAKGKVRACKRCG